MRSPQAAKVFGYVIALVLLTTSALAQGTRSDLDQLKAGISSSLSVKDTDRLISEADEAFKQTLKTSIEPISRAGVYVKFAEFQKGLLTAIDQRLLDKSVPSGEKTDFFFKYQSTAKKLRSALDNASEILTKQPLDGESGSALAAVKFQTGWYLENYRPLRTGPVSYKERMTPIREAQKQYAEAIKLRDDLSGGGDDDVNVYRFVLANSYIGTGDFEPAFLLLSRFIGSTESKYGATSPALEPALHMQLALAVLVGDNDSAQRITAKLKSISKQNDTDPAPYLKLTGRVIAETARGFKEKSGHIGLETKTKTRTSSNGTPAYSVSQSTVQGGSYLGVGIPVIITVGIDGSVIEAVAQVDDPKTKTKAERDVRSWKLVPLNLNGEPREMHGLVYYWIYD